VLAQGPKFTTLPFRLLRATHLSFARFSDDGEERVASRLVWPCQRPMLLRTLLIKYGAIFARLPDLVWPGWVGIKDFGGLWAQAA
jgi:hypothetical protein